MDFSDLLVIDKKETGKKAIFSKKGRIDYSDLLKIKPEKISKRIDYSDLLTGVKRIVPIAKRTVEEAAKPFLFQKPEIVKKGEAQLGREALMLPARILTPTPAGLTEAIKVGKKEGVLPAVKAGVKTAGRAFLKPMDFPSPELALTEEIFPIQPFEQREYGKLGWIGNVPRAVSASMIQVLGWRVADKLMRVATTRALNPTEIEGITEAYGKELAKMPKNVRANVMPTGNLARVLLGQEQRVPRPFVSKALGLKPFEAPKPSVKIAGVPPIEKPALIKPQAVTPELIKPMLPIAPKLPISPLKTSITTPISKEAMPTAQEAIAKGMGAEELTAEELSEIKDIQLGLDKLESKVSKVIGKKDAQGILYDLGIRKDPTGAVLSYHKLKRFTFDFEEKIRTVYNYFAKKENKPLATDVSYGKDPDNPLKDLRIQVEEGMYDKDISQKTVQSLKAIISPETKSQLSEYEKAKGEVKPKLIKARKPKTVIGYLKGKVSPESLASYDSKWREQGILSIAKKGGIGLDAHYSELVSQGIIPPAPENVNPGEWAYQQILESKGKLLSKVSAEDKMIEEHLKQMEEKYEDARERISEVESVIEKETSEQAPDEIIDSAEEDLPEWVTETQQIIPGAESKFPEGKIPATKYDLIQETTELEKMVEKQKPSFIKPSEAGQISTKYFSYIPEKIQQNLDEVQYVVKNPISKSIINDIQYVNLKAVRNAADGLVRVDYLRGLTSEEDLMLTDLLEGKQIKTKDRIQFNKLYVLSIKLRKSLNEIWNKASNAGVKEKIVTDEGVEWIPIRHIDKYVPREIHPDIREKLNGGLKQLYQRIMELKQQGAKHNIKQAILEAKEQGDPYIVRLIDWLEEQNIHTTPSKIVRLIDKLVNRDYISSYGHLERPRLIENALPPEFYERRASVLFNRYFAGAGRRIAEVEKFGSTNEKLFNRLKFLAKVNPEEEKLIRKLISRYQDITDHPISSKIATVISISKIGLGTSTIPNLTQFLISTIPKQGVWTFLRGAFNLVISGETKGLVAKTGLPYTNIIRQIMGYKDKGILDTVNDRLITWNLFKGVNRANALLTASSTEYWVKNALLPRTKSNLPFLRKQAFDNLAKLRITPDDIIQGKISDEKLIDAMLLASTNYQLFSDITKEPLWLSNPHLRWATVLKRFGAKQLLFSIHDIIYDELKNANPLPLLRLIAGGILGGAFVIWANRKIYDTVSYIKETITGETREPPNWYAKWDDEDRRLWVQMIDLFSQAGGLGVLSDIARLDAKSNWSLSRNMEFLLEPVILNEAIRSGKIIDILAKGYKMRGRHKIEIPIEERLQKASKETIRGFPLTKFFIEKE